MIKYSKKLECPNCKADLDSVVNNDDWYENEIRTITCPKCGKKYEYRYKVDIECSTNPIIDIGDYRNLNEIPESEIIFDNDKGSCLVKDDYSDGVLIHLVLYCPRTKEILVNFIIDEDNLNNMIDSIEIT